MTPIVRGAADVLDELGRPLQSVGPSRRPLTQSESRMRKGVRIALWILGGVVGLGVQGYELALRGLVAALKGRSA